MPDDPKKGSNLKSRKFPPSLENLSDASRLINWIATKFFGTSMARQLRIEYPGALYHVYSRGNQKQPIFLSDDDRFYFLKTLGEANQRLSAVVHTYCLMKNHYHLALETPAGNLSKTMHFINAAYSIYLNVKHGRCGHLFQGRFRAILIEAGSYARTLSMYIHGNPVREGIVIRPEEFEWSSARAYFGLVRPPSWLRMDLILGYFGNSPERLRKDHEQYLLLSSSVLPDPAFSKASRIGIMGSDDFVDKIRETFKKKSTRPICREIPELRRLLEGPGISRIRSEVIAHVGADNRLVKKATIYIAHKNTALRLSEIGAFFNIGPAAAGVAYRKMRSEISSSEPLKRAIDEIETRLFSKAPDAR
jgi:REP element-mobilizing transposase RayT